jgi:dimethylglycine dehydrogenase
MIGFVTSGAYGHTLQRSLAMGLIDPALAKTGTNVLVHVVGAERKAKIIAASPYDPEGRAMRG